MKKKLALVMAAIMTVAMVPMTAFASTDITAVDEIHVAEDGKFTSRVELKRGDHDAYLPAGEKTEIELTLENGKFAKNDKDEYIMDVGDYGVDGVWDVDVKSATKAVVTIGNTMFNDKVVTLPIVAEAVAAGDVVATFSSNVTEFSTVKAVIATVSAEKVEVKSAGVKTFVEDADEDAKKLEAITITGLTNGALSTEDIKLKLKGDYTFDVDGSDFGKGDVIGTVTFLNDKNVRAELQYVDEDEAIVKISDYAGIDATKFAEMTITGLMVQPTKGCKAGDVATLTVSGKEVPTTKLEVAKMVEEAVTYTVADKELPSIWAGAKNDEVNTLKLHIEENTGDILNTSRKATFTFPEGIEVVDVVEKGVTKAKETYTYKEEIDENVVKIWNYGESAESDATDLDMEFILNAAPTFKGDVKVTLGGEFDDVEFTVATVKAPYTVEAKTSQVLIDYRFVPVNEIVITEAEDGILEDGDEIVLAVEKMAFEDAGSFDVTEGDIEADVRVNEDNLVVEIDDESTEASTIVVSGLELYLDRTLPVGGYALSNVNYDKYDKIDDLEDLIELGKNFKTNVLWQNSFKSNELADLNGFFKYEPVTVNDEYVEVVTQGRDSDDSSLNKKIVITIGATTMAVGTETITLDTPAYINAENYTELPLRAVAEAFGANVAWDDASRTVTILMGQRVVSMAIGSKTMYINGTPVAMNTAPEITNGRTFVPVRDLANALGISKVDWNEASATVTLN